MDPLVREGQRRFKGWNDDDTVPGCKLPSPHLLTVNPAYANDTGSCAYGTGGWSHQIAEALNDGGVYTQDRNLYQSLMGMGVYQDSTTTENPNYVRAVLKDNPVAYWRLGEPGGNGYSGRLSRVAYDVMGQQLTNYCPNGSMEQDLQGWNAQYASGCASGAGLYQTGGAYEGNYCAKVVTTATNQQGVYCLATSLFTTGQVVTASIWLKGQNGGEQVRLFFGTNNAGDYAWGPTLTLTNGWNQYSVTWTVRNNATWSPNFNIVNATATAQTWYMDACQIVLGSAAPSTFWEGNGGLDGLYAGSAAANILTNALDANSTTGWAVTGPTLWNGATLAPVTGQSAPSGSYAAQITATHVSAPPTGLTATASGTGGTLPAGTYYFKITTRTYNGESTGSNEASVTITAGQNIVLNWTGSVDNVNGYNVYRATTAGGESTSPAQVTQLGNVFTYTDTGTAVSAGAVPTTNTAVPPYMGTIYTMPGSYASGQPYVASVWLKGAVGGEAVLIYLGNSGSDQAATNITLTNTWQRYSVTWTPSAAETSVYFGIRTQASSGPVTWYANGAQVTVGSPIVPFSDTQGVKLGQPGAVQTNDNGTGVTFDGQSGYVTRNGGIIGSLANSSVEMWVKSSTATGQALYVERPASGGDIWKLEMSGGHLYFTHRDDSNTLSQHGALKSFVDGNWHHVALTKAGTAVTFYVDGVVDSGYTMTGSDTLTQALITRIAADPQDTTKFFPGEIAEVAVYNYALSAQQVANHYAAR